VATELAEQRQGKICPLESDDKLFEKRLRKIIGEELKMAS
jgi:hypothetical protein